LQWRGIGHDFAVGQTVLIVDDHPMFRRLARRLLEEEGFEVVGEAANGASALEAVRVLAPEIVLLDVMLPDISGLEVAARLASTRQQRTLVLTSSRSRADFGGALEEAASDGFVAKADLTATTFRAVLRRL